MQPPVERFGAAGGEPVVYLHGSPGTPVEASLLDSAARDAGVALLALDRAGVAPGTDGEPYLRALAGAVRDLSGGRPLPIMGFSIGAALALRVEARLGTGGPLLLLSAAGPLDRPSAFDGMGAGAGVFRAARAGGARFAALVRVQSATARLAPGVLARVLFAGSAADDRAFASAPANRPLLARILRTGLGDNADAYRRDLLAYVADWSTELARVRAPVALWHGRADNWAPVVMVHDLAARLPGPVRLVEGEGGHYGTLVAAAPAAFAALREAAFAPSPNRAG